MPFAPPVTMATRSASRSMAYVPARTPTTGAALASWWVTACSIEGLGQPRGAAIGDALAVPEGRETRPVGAGLTHGTSACGAIHLASGKIACSQALGGVADRLHLGVGGRVRGRDHRARAFSDDPSIPD